VAEGLDRLVRTVQEAVDADAATFLASDIDEDGGKIILTAGVPTTQVDDEGRMLRALRRIADSDQLFPLKIGANRGHVFAGEIGTDFRSTYTVMGDTVNLAARLMAAAPSGEVYAAPGVLDRSLTLFETNVLPPFYVKGKDAPVQAYSVGVETGSRPVEWKRELPFTGRAAELRLLRTAIGAVGGGQSLRVSGETGIGKTRLVLEALADVPPGETFFVRAEPNGVSNAYWAFRDPLRHRLGIERSDQVTMASELARAVASLDDGLLPFLPLIADVAHIGVPETPETAAIEPRFRPDQTAATIVELFRASSDGRQVILIDDAHWLDQASAALASALARSAAGHPWVVVATERRDEASFAFPADTEIDLQPLDEDAVRQIVISMTEAAPLRPHDLDAIVERAGGSPLFLGEILRLVRETGSTDTLPDSLDAVVGAEIDTLPALPRRLLRYSSVLGRSFRRVVLDELLRPEDVDLDTATRRTLARFIEPDGKDRLRFRHAVLHDVAYSGLSYRKRKELHGRAGEVIERLARNDTDAVAEFLALHYAEAGEHDKAWRYGVVAGDRAKAAYANVEAGEHYRRALAHSRYLPGTSNGDVLRVAESLGDVLEQAGLFGEALAAFGDAMERADDRAFKARIMMKRARVHVRVGSYSAAVRQTTSGVRLVEQLQGSDASLARSQLVALASGIRLQQGRPGLALPLAERARDLALANGDRDALARAYTVLDGALEMLGRPEEAVYSGRARAIYEELGDTPGVATVDNNVGVRAYDEGRWDDAVAAYSRAQEEFRLSGNLPQAALCGANIGEVLVSQGRLDEAEPILGDAVRDLRSADLADLAIFAEIQLARLDLARARFTEACEALERLQAEASQLGQRDIALEAALHLADGLISSGASDRALEVLATAESEAGDEAALYEAGLLRIQARAAFDLGRNDEAFELASQGLEVAREQGLVYEQALIHRIRGQALAASDGRDLEEANRLLQVLGVIA
jgi:tetratricopeptide (TPR) repeat protein